MRLFEDIIQQVKQKNNFWLRLDLLSQLILGIAYLIWKSILDGFEWMEPQIRKSLQQLDKSKNIQIKVSEEAQTEDGGGRSSLPPILSDERLKPLLESKTALRCLLKACERTEIVSNDIIDELRQIVQSDEVEGIKFKINQVKSKIKIIRDFDIVILLAEYHLKKQQDANL